MPIVFDAVTGVPASTFAHTIGAGENRLLMVATISDVVSGTDITSVTYNGVALTQLVSGAFSFNNEVNRLWYLVNPPVGTFNVILTGATTLFAGAALSYRGVKQVAPPDAIAVVSGGNATTRVANLTTIAPGCWTVLITKNGAGNAGAGAGSTLRAARGLNYDVFDSNASLPAGATSMAATHGSNPVWCHTIFSFAPAPGNDRMFLAF
jgi:hypothetical protein